MLPAMILSEALGTARIPRVAGLASRGLPDDPLGGVTRPATPPAQLRLGRSANLCIRMCALPGRARHALVLLEGQGKAVCDFWHPFYLKVDRASDGTVKPPPQESVNEVATWRKTNTQQPYCQPGAGKHTGMPRRRGSDVQKKLGSVAKSISRLSGIEPPSLRLRITRGGAR
jgi:hypothetical protein